MIQFLQTLDPELTIRVADEEGYLLDIVTARPIVVKNDNPEVYYFLNEQGIAPGSGIKDYSDYHIEMLTQTEK